MGEPSCFFSAALSGITCVRMYENANCKRETKLIV